MKCFAPLQSSQIRNSVIMGWRNFYTTHRDTANPEGYQHRLPYINDSSKSPWQHVGVRRHCTGACGGPSIMRTIVDSVLHSTGVQVHIPITVHRPYRCDHLPTLGVIITDYRYTLRPATFSQLPTGVTRVQDIGCVLQMEVVREKWSLSLYAVEVEFQWNKKIVAWLHCGKLGLSSS